MHTIESFKRLGLARSEFEGAIFDFDGTLADSMWVWGDIDRLFCEEFGFQLPDDYTENIVGLGFEGYARYFIDEFDVKMTVEECCAEFNRLAGECYRNDVYLKPGAKEFLANLREEGIPCAIASSLCMDLLKPALEHNGVWGWFDTIRLCDDYDTHKSEPLIYEVSADALGVDLAHCVVFEDILPATRSAQSRGAFAVAVLDPDNEAQNTDLVRTVADHAISSWTELL